MYNIFLKPVLLLTLGLNLHVIPANGVSLDDSGDDYDGNSLEDLEAKLAAELQGRIVGGREASEGEAPYQLSLMEHGSHKCGATLVISPTSKSQIVITAGHCVCKIGTNQLLPADVHSVRGGSLNRFAGQTRNVRKIVLHEKYDGKFFNDIAILFIDGSFHVDGTLKPVDLPDEETKDPGLGETLTVSGWGDLLEHARSTQTNLRVVEVPVIPNGVCAKLYAKFDSQREFVRATSMCAGFDKGGKDSCQGDSGGPAVANDERGRFLAGVVSWGRGCARENTPGVYVRVSKYTRWIAETTKEEEEHGGSSDKVDRAEYYWREI